MLGGRCSGSPFKLLLFDEDRCHRVTGVRHIGKAMEPRRWDDAMLGHLRFECIDGRDVLRFRVVDDERMSTKSGGERVWY